MQENFNLSLKKNKMRIFFVCFLLSFHGLTNNERVQRLILPTTSSIFTIVPKVDMPMMSSSSVNSGFSFKMPITIKFPSLMDIAKSINQYENNIGMETTFDKPLVTNLTVVNVTKSRSRINFYKAIENANSRYGRVCLMRAICEVAEVPLISSSTGLLGEIIDLLLTLSHLPKHSALNEYVEAEKIGRKRGKKGYECKQRYKDCPLSLFNIVNIQI